MGLRMTLPKDKNHMYYDFIDAYWAIENVIYSLGMIDFSLRAFPSREAKLMTNDILPDPSIGYGSAQENVNSILYEWHVFMELTNIFPDFADKNNRSNGCFYLAILQSTISFKSRCMRDFFMLCIRFGFF